MAFTVLQESRSCARAHGAAKAGEAQVIRRRPSKCCEGCKDRRLHEDFTHQAVPRLDVPRLSLGLVTGTRQEKVDQHQSIEKYMAHALGDKAQLRFSLD